MNGILLLNKPAGMTSFQAVRKCRNLFHEKKAGHSGTLDPNAEGMMLLFFGKYTKLIPYCISNHKHYLAEFALGELRDTEDIWGEVIETKIPHGHTQEELDQISASFVGDILQVPPMYSALKKDGKKLYEYAREGIEVERKARPVTINSLSVKEIAENHYEMDAVVSSGTYIRTLIVDYAEKMGELASMTKLTRLGIENITLKDAVTLEEVEEGKGLIDPMLILDPAWTVYEVEDDADIKNGKKIVLPCEQDQLILTYQGEILAAYARIEKNIYQCVRGLF